MSHLIRKKMELVTNFVQIGQTFLWKPHLSGDGSLFGCVSARPNGRHSSGPHRCPWPGSGCRCLCCSAHEGSTKEGKNATPRSHECVPGWVSSRWPGLSWRHDKLVDP